MKRKPLIFAIALLLVVGAALWGVNYRLDHPPLTKADREFRALVASADSVQISYFTSSSAPQRLTQTEVTVTLRPEQTREFIELFRLLGNENSAGSEIGNSRDNHSFDFERGGTSIAKYNFWQNSGGSWIGQDESSQQSNFERVYKINPRFEKNLNAELDAYLPERLAPVN